MRLIAIKVITHISIFSLDDIINELSRRLPSISFPKAKFITISFFKFLVHQLITNQFCTIPGVCTIQLHNQTNNNDTTKTIEIVPDDLLLHREIAQPEPMSLPSLILPTHSITIKCTYCRTFRRKPHPISDRLIVNDSIQTISSFIITQELPEVLVTLQRYICPKCNWIRTLTQQQLADFIQAYWNEFKKLVDDFTCNEFDTYRTNESNEPNEPNEHKPTSLLTPLIRQRARISINPKRIAKQKMIAFDTKRFLYPLQQRIHHMAYYWKMLHLLDNYDEITKQIRNAKPVMVGNREGEFLIWLKQKRIDK